MKCRDVRRKCIAGQLPAIKKAVQELVRLRGLLRTLFPFLRSFLISPIVFATFIVITFIIATFVITTFTVVACYGDAFSWWTLSSISRLYGVQFFASILHRCLSNSWPLSFRAIALAFYSAWVDSSDHEPSRPICSYEFVSASSCHHC